MPDCFLAGHTGFMESCVTKRLPVNQQFPVFILRKVNQLLETAGCLARQDSRKSLYLTKKLARKAYFTELQSHSFKVKNVITL